MSSQKGHGSTELCCRQCSSASSKQIGSGFAGACCTPYSYSSSAAVDAQSPGKLLAVRSLLSTSNPHSTLATGLCGW